MGFIVDKLDGLFRKNLLSYSFPKLYNLNAKEFNAMKYLRHVIYLQRAFRYFKKKVAERKSLQGSRKRGVRAKRNDDNDDDKIMVGANQPKARHRRPRDDDDDDVIVGASQGQASNRGKVSNDDMKRRYSALRDTNFKNVLMN